MASEQIIFLEENAISYPRDKVFVESFNIIEERVILETASWSERPPDIETFVLGASFLDTSSVLIEGISGVDADYWMITQTADTPSRTTNGWSRLMPTEFFYK